jgi:hypothetical protein
MLYYENGMGKKVPVSSTHEYDAIQAAKEACFSSGMMCRAFRDDVVIFAGERYIRKEFKEDRDEE